MNEHGVVGLSPLHRDQLDARSSNRKFGATVYRQVGLEAAYLFGLEAFAKEALVENSGCHEFAVDFFSVVGSGIESQARIQPAKIGMASNVIPVGMCNEDCRQLRQVGRICSQRFIGCLGRVGPCASIDAD